MSPDPQSRTKEVNDKTDAQKPAQPPPTIVDALDKFFKKNSYGASLADRVTEIKEAQKAAALKTLQEGDALAKEHNWRAAADKYSEVGSKLEFNAYADSEKDSVVIMALIKLAALLREQKDSTVEEAEELANNLKKELEAFGNGMKFVHAAARASSLESKQCNETALGYFEDALTYNPSSSRSKLKIAQITAHTVSSESALEKVDVLLKEDSSCAEALAYKVMLLGVELNDEKGAELAKQSLRELYNAHCNPLAKAKPQG